jgi:hypothetical protein
MTEKFSPEAFDQPQHIRDAEELYERAAIEAEAWQAIAASEYTPSAEVPEQERRDNARSAIFEALTASGHLSRIELTGDLEEVNRQVLSRLISGYKNCTDPHEQKRRFSELCNELIIQKTLRLVALGELDESTAVAEFSDYPLGLADARARSLGYRSFNRKGMARSTHLRCNANGSYTRIIEQMSRSNGTPEATFAFLGDAGIWLSGDAPPDLAVLNKPFLYEAKHDYADGVVALQRRLDQYAGPDIQYGEMRGTQALHVPYEQVREESAWRESEVEKHIDHLANFEARLESAEAAGHITSEQRRGQYAEELLQILRSICLLAPEYAEDCFGTTAAGYYQKASDFVAAGEYERAEMIVDDAKSVEQAVVICGMTVDAKTAEKLGIDPDSVSKLTKLGKENWKRTKGVCRIPKCPSPKPTDLGPCRICMKSCQPLFDAKKNPATEYARTSAQSTQEERAPTRPDRADTAKRAGMFALVA